MLNRRRLIAGLGAMLAAPAIIRTPGLLMPVKALPLDGMPVEVELGEWQYVMIGGGQPFWAQARHYPPLNNKNAWPAFWTISNGVYRA